MKTIIISLKMLLVMTVITGIAYPLLITAFAETVFPNKAVGSLVGRDGKIVCSELIGQKFSDPANFWGRPSAIDNNPNPSGGSNLNPLGDDIKEQIAARLDTIRKYHGNIDITEIPKDLLFASASGVDPHISLACAYFQIDRISSVRHFSDEQKNKLKSIVNSYIESEDLHVFGEKRINVNLLNMKLNDEFGK